ncbi:MAG: hypothetical protein Q7R33_05140 [Nitrosarchaeum sp.]|nr:hypothetical protein [Nitrosarchaeum sp.]
MAKIQTKLTQIEDKKQSSTFEDIFNDFINNLIEEDKEVDILTFVESPYYLNIKTLQPPQRFILKAFYGLPFDNTIKQIRLRIFPHDEEGKLLTEVEYAQYLINQKRTNLTTIFDDVGETSELILACGRRGGKTFIASIISSYEAYKLIIKDNPQAYYHMAEDEKIKIVNVASSGDQALELATQIQNRIFNSEWFLPYISSFNGEEINLKTKHDIKKMKDEEARYGKPLKQRATIKIESLLCSARGSRGGSVIVALFDELAHFVDNEGNRGGKKVYESLTPSGATFGRDSKIICISSPYTKSGIFYELQMASYDDVKSTRMLQMPTWEMNPNIDFEFLRSRYKKDPESFWTEYGAQFSTTVTGFFKFPERIYECVDVVEYKDTLDENGEVKKTPIYRCESQYATGRYRYYIAMDPATNNDGYAMAMVHCERDATGRLIIYVDRWRKWSVDDPEFSEFDFIDIELIDDYILDLTRKFRVEMIVYDQFESAASIQKFIKSGINAIKTHFSRQYNMKIYKNLRSIIYDKRISILFNETGLKELVYLQEKKIGKKQFIVEAPKSGDITTDDLADVLANAVSIAIDNEMEGSVASTTKVSVASRSSGITSLNINQRLPGMSRVGHGGGYFDKLVAARRLGIYR